MKKEMKKFFWTAIAVLAVVSFSLEMTACYVAFEVCEAFFDWSCALHILITFCAEMATAVAVCLFCRDIADHILEGDGRIGRKFDLAREIVMG